MARTIFVGIKYLVYCFLTIGAFFQFSPDGKPPAACMFLGSAINATKGGEVILNQKSSIHHSVITVC